MQARCRIEPARERSILPAYGRAARPRSTTSGPQGRPAGSLGRQPQEPGRGALEPRRGGSESSHGVNLGMRALASARLHVLARSPPEAHASGYPLPALWAGAVGREGPMRHRACTRHIDGARVRQSLRRWDRRLYHYTARYSCPGRSLIVGRTAPGGADTCSCLILTMTDRGNSPSPVTPPDETDILE